MSEETFNWLQLDDPEGSAKWIKEQTLKKLWQEFGYCQLFIYDCKLSLPESGECLGQARRLLRQIRCELMRRGCWDV